jgi:hypothetical protein
LGESESVAPEQVGGAAEAEFIAHTTEDMINNKMEKQRDPLQRVRTSEQMVNNGVMQSLGVRPPVLPLLLKTVQHYIC